MPLKRSQVNLRPFCPFLPFQSSLINEHEGNPNSDLKLEDIYNFEPQHTKTDSGWMMGCLTDLVEQSGWA